MMTDVQASTVRLSRQAERRARPADRPDFEIVPRVGLVLAAIALPRARSPRSPPTSCGRSKFLHVAGGAAWTIIDLFLGLVLGPIIGRMSIPARIEFTTRLMPKIVVIMPVVVTLTLAAGWQLSTLLGHEPDGYPDHGWVVASMIVVGVMAVIALGLLEPANIAVLIELEEAPPEPRGDRAADEALRLLGRRAGPDAGRDTRDHDQAGVVDETSASVLRPSPSSG